MSGRRDLFVTGTDTGIGKTVVSVGLLHGLAARGLRTAGYKPVAAGCTPGPDGLMNADAEALRAASSVELDYDEINPVALEPAIAPHIAAREAGIEIDADRLVEGFTALQAKADVVVVEGAGGWLVPLGDDPDRSFADLAANLRLDVLLVVGLRLGCLNHALLTAEAVTARGLNLAGWVANTLDEDMPRLAANVESLDRRIAAPLIGRVPFLTTVSPSAVAGQLDLSRF